MRRIVLTAALVAAAVAAAGWPAPAATHPASVKLVACSVDEHEAVFRGRMHSIEGADRMWMRFTLLERTGSDGYRVLKAPGLGVWRRSKPGVGSFSYRQVVRGLPANAAYRMRVDFRWLAGSRVIRQHRRLSGVCRQFDGLPNLTVTIADSRRTRVRGVRRYAVRVANRGRAPVADASVAFAIDGRPVAQRTVPSLLPGAELLVAFRGPDCVHSVRAVADPAGLVVESSETDNAHELACAEITRR